MRKGDIVAAHQGGKGILGLIFLAKNGYCTEFENQYDCFDLKPKPLLYFDNPIPFKLIKELPEANVNFEFVKFHQNTVFQITPIGFEIGFCEAENLFYSFGHQNSYIWEGYFLFVLITSHFFLSIV